ncbi:hypothetical protein PPERSA_07391 [Pseudocohnilembus persalinus]|uniref:PQ-loop repeat n=1 Tax=Pseudocohnilembus persalinus TaxID=266149 RepID=A0A0V0QA81_PSEPJ|nr:hypothetical protein PPERSA_07391 [Pseudocohnilembus persalinus]|eukprot:KRW99148.1 hypothetical protein PPERSA_07391 [Pseudocohnilembus persalinus]
MANFFLDVGISTGPVLGYISQYKLIQKNESLGNFSIDVCAILIFSNILRIFFWFGKPFEFALLAQSFFMIAMQIYLLKLCVETNKDIIGLSMKQNNGKSINLMLEKNLLKQKFWLKFWRWEVYESYLYSVIAFFLGNVFLFTMFNQSTFYVEMLGAFSALIEATLGLPQLIKNFKNKKAHGVSYALIGSWFLGDAFKTFYFILKKQPMQFIICGIAQLCVDIMIILQIKFYQ